MLEVNADDLLKDLEKYLAETTRKLENMVRGFAYEVTLAASDNTPVGDYESLFTNHRYAAYYHKRADEYGIPVDVGFHAGAWSANTDGNFDFTSVIYDRNDVGRFAKQGLAAYKLGETVYIGAEGPAFEALEAGSSQQSLDGIVAPTLRQIEASYKVDLQRYFKQG